MTQRKTAATILLLLALGTWTANVATASAPTFTLPTATAARQG